MSFNVALLTVLTELSGVLQRLNLRNVRFRVARRRSEGLEEERVDSLRGAFHVQLRLVEELVRRFAHCSERELQEALVRNTVRELLGDVRLPSSSPITLEMTLHHALGVLFSSVLPMARLSSDALQEQLGVAPVVLEARRIDLQIILLAESELRDLLSANL